MDFRDGALKNQDVELRKRTFPPLATGIFTQLYLKIMIKSMI